MSGTKGRGHGSDVRRRGGPRMSRAVVTGAGGAIGSAICRGLAGRGHDIVAVDVDPDGLAALARELPGGSPRIGATSRPRQNATGWCGPWEGAVICWSTSRVSSSRHRSSG